MTEDKTQPLYALADPEASVKLVVVYNPLDPSDRDLAELVWGCGRTVADYLDGLPASVPWAAAVNGKLIEADEWSVTRLQPDDCLTVMPIPTGGGDGKTIMRMVAMLVVAVVAAYAAPAIVAGMGVTAGAGFSAGAIAATTALVGGVITMAGSMLVNAILPAAKQDMPDTSLDDLKESASYGIDGPKNSAMPGLAVPVAYGQFRLGGNLTNVYTENAGDTQYLYVQTALSEGEIDAIEDIEVNDQPVSNYNNVWVDYRLGYPDQDPMGWFGRTVNPRNKGATLRSTEWVQHETLTEVDQLRFDFVFPMGLSRTDDKNGDKLSHTVPLDIQYRRKGDSAWNIVAEPEWINMLPNYLVWWVTEGWIGHTPGNEHNKSSYGEKEVTSPPKTHRVQMTVEQPLLMMVYEGWVLDFNGGPSYSLQLASEGIVEIQYAPKNSGNWKVLATKSVVPKIEKSTNVQPYPSAPGDEFRGEQTHVSVFDTFSVDETLPEGEYDFRIVATGKYQEYYGGPYKEGELIGGQFKSARALATTPVKVEGRQRQPLRKSFSTEVLPEGVYEVRMRRAQPEDESDLVLDRVMISDINEIITEKIGYVHTAMLGLKIRLTDQLNRRPKVTALVRGRRLNIYDDNGNVVDRRWSQNPAWITLDILMGRYGGSMSPDRIDFPAFVDWAEHCDEKGFVFNGVFDFESNVWDSLQRVMRVGRAQLTRSGTRYTVVIERPDAPVMMFGVNNIIEGSFKSEWLSQEDRANEIDLQFYDENDGFRQNMVRVTDPDAIDRGLPRRTARLNLMGITSKAKAINEAWLQIAMNKHIRQTVTFQAPLEAIACTVGDLILVQHDMPKWGFAGRLESDSTKTTLNLDRPVEFTEGKTHRVLVHHSAIQRATGTIYTVIGNSVYIEGLSGLVSAKRLKGGGKDLHVTRLVDQSPYVEAVVEDASALAAGQSVELWDTDVIEERNVAHFYGVDEATSIELDAPLTVAPAALTSFMFGPTDKIKKPFRVTKIGHDGDDTREIGAIEYNESVYETPRSAIPTPNYSLLQAGISHVTELTAYEDMRIVKGSAKTFLRVEWQRPELGIYGGAQVYKSTNGGGWQLVSTVPGEALTAEFEAIEGEEIKVRVVAMDPAGSRTALTTAPEVNLTVVGRLTPPENVTGFKAERVATGIKLVWNAVADIDLKGYEIRRGLNWESGEQIGFVRAGETFFVGVDKAGLEYFHIRAVDLDGRLSPMPATTEIYVPAPTAVTGFSVVRSLEQIVFVWEDVPTAVRYELREGVNWATSRLIARTDTNQHIMPVDVGGNRTFWIKAIDERGVMSEKAAFSVTNVAELDTRNVIIERVEQDLGWDGHVVNLYRTPDGLARLKDGQVRGEYVSVMSLPTEMRSRVVSNVLISAISGTTTWADADFTWRSEKATRTWAAEQGDLEEIQMFSQIALSETPGAEIVSAMPLNNSDADTVGSATVTESAVSFDPRGRFADGARVTDLTQLAWATSVPSVFTIKQWITMIATDRNARILRLTGNDGHFMELIHHGDDNTFTLRCSDGHDIRTDYFNVVTDRPHLVVITQTDAKRRLMIGEPGSGHRLVAEIDAAPLGSFNALKVA